MKLIVYTLVFIAFSLQHIWAVAESNTEQLRDGYSLQVSQNESGQTRQLYYKEKLLGESQNYSISPSGEYVAFQNASGGKLFLYRVSDDALQLLAEESTGTVKSYDWNETLEIVRINFDNNQEAQNFAIE